MSLIKLFNKFMQNILFVLTFILFLSIYLSNKLNNKGIFGIGVIIVTFFCLFVFFEEMRSIYRMKKGLKEKLKLEKINMRILLYESKPTPALSLINALNKFDIKVENIDSIEFMCYFIDHNYTMDIIENLIHKNPDIKITIQGCKQDVNLLLNHQNNVTCIETDSILTEHFNYIKTKNGENFVWYEPYHSIEGNEHLMPQGAYLAQMLSR
jgi:hypothetical protein